MPCRDYEWEPSIQEYQVQNQDLQKEIETGKKHADKLARLLCTVLRVCEKNYFELIDENPEVKEWWEKHKEEDRKREEAERRKQKKKEALINKALSKLTTEERSALGI